MRCFVQTNLDVSVAEAWSAAKRPATLLRVTRGFLGFSGFERIPSEWREGMVVHTRFWFFHLFPAWWSHTMTVKQIDEDRRVIASSECGGIIRVWNHTIRVSPAPPGCVYSDEIEIQAGLLTLFIWLYANIFYRYRQARWRQLSRELGQG
jgi:hypothetical protein